MSHNPGNPDPQPPSPDGVPDPQFMKQFQAMIGNWAEATAADKTEEANHAAIQAFIMAGAEALRNPTPNLLLKMEADELETKADWAAAEVVRRKVLAVDESSGQFGMIAKAQMDLCRLLRLTGRLAEAGQFASAATSSARRTEIGTIIVMALECEVLCALEQGESPKALTLAAEALKIIEPGKQSDHIRARAQTTHARCLLVNHDATGADRHLRWSWELLQKYAGDGMLPGIIGTFANWWEVKSRLDEQSGDLEGARAAMSRAIAFRRQLEGSFVLFALARALERLASLAGTLAMLPEKGQL